MNGRAGMQGGNNIAGNFMAGVPEDYFPVVRPTLTAGALVHFQNHKGNAGTHCRNNSLYPDGIVR